jgi:hypothetical protein
MTQEPAITPLRLVCACRVRRWTMSGRGKATKLGVKAESSYQAVKALEASPLRRDQHQREQGEERAGCCYPGMDHNVIES